ncbi:MAG: hypothetical protein II950_01330 [Prevotella sp.]|nr:hypothetical protein [Prevotella sp.]
MGRGTERRIGRNARLTARLIMNTAGFTLIGRESGIFYCPRNDAIANPSRRMFSHALPCL